MAPNPAQHTTEVAFISNVESKYIIQIMDLTGRMVMVNEGRAIAGENSTGIYLDNVSKGIYLMLVINGEEQSFKKLHVN
ncbi:MAG: T9SS type A sorting domain-containing protein [Bacteroidota bacterium]